jgi:pimeloyl-ACP methyl ester carboxylesterase
MTKKVVFIHGLFFTSYRDESYFRPVLEKKGIKCYFFNYKHRFGNIKLEKISEEFDLFLSENVGKDFILVGISQGGLIAAYWLEFRGGKEKCRNCITVCTPFHGSYLANLSYFPFSPFTGIQEMPPQSSFLVGLLDRINKSKVHYYCIWDPFDKIVVPGKNARLRNAKNISIIGAVHNIFPRYQGPTLRIIENIVHKRE